MKSEVLARDVSFSILFPDSYKTEPDKRYPVIYVLDGWYANGMGLFYNNAIGQRPFIQEFADQKRSSWCSMTTTPLSNGARTGSKPTDRVMEKLATPEDYELFDGLSPSDVGIVEALLERRKFRRGELIVQFGAPAGELFFLAQGCASVTVPLSGGAQKRLATFSPGMAFGEMAMLDRAPRSAAVTADTEVECDLLNLKDFERLGKSHPHIQIVLLRNLALSLSRKLRKANLEISVFDY